MFADLMEAPDEEAEQVLRENSRTKVLHETPKKLPDFKERNVS